MKIKLTARIEGDANDRDTKQTVAAFSENIIERELQRIKREMEGEGHDVSVVVWDNSAELPEMKGNLK